MGSRETLSQYEANEEFLVALKEAKTTPELCGGVYMYIENNLNKFGVISR